MKIGIWEWIPNIFGKHVQNDNYDNKSEPEEFVEQESVVERVQFVEQKMIIQNRINNDKLLVKQGSCKINVVGKINLDALNQRTRPPKRKYRRK